MLYTSLSHSIRSFFVVSITLAKIPSISCFPLIPAHCTPALESHLSTSAILPSNLSKPCSRSPNNLLVSSSTLESLSRRNPNANGNTTKKNPAIQMHLITITRSRLCIHFIFEIGGMNVNIIELEYRVWCYITFYQEGLVLFSFRAENLHVVFSSG